MRRSQGPDGTIMLEYTASTQWFTGRESDLETALLNLLDNALRFSPPGGKVELSVADAPGSRLEIAVSDHGRKMLLSRGVSPGRIHVVRPGFDHVPARGGFHVERYGPVRALCVAQWIPRKGILTLVQAWTLLERPGAVLELVGETDADGTFTLQEFECLGACDRAPVVMINNDHWHESLTPDTVPQFVDDLRVKGLAALTGCHHKVE